MSEYDMVDRLEKQIEGSNLALAAVAEVLQKMDSRLSKAEDEEIELAQDQEDAFEKQEIIKAVAGEVYSLIKADSNPTGAQWGNSTDASVQSMKEGTDDSGNNVKAPRKTEDVNVTLQAMQKQLNLLRKDWAGKDEEEDENENNGDPQNGDPQDGDDPDVDEEGNPIERNMRYSLENEAAYPVLENMQKQINELTSALRGNFDMQKMVQNETEGRLRKMGFREETSLQRPTLLRYEDSLGIDGTTPITKTADSPEDMVDQMLNMSYKDLRVLQERIESGDTDGIPQEFLG